MFDLLDWAIDKIGDLFGDQLPLGGAPQSLGDLPVHTDVSTGLAPSLAAGQEIIDRDPVLSGVQQTMREASSIYRDAMEGTELSAPSDATPHAIASPGASDGTQAMTNQLEAMNTSDGIRASVAEHEQSLRDANAASLDRQAADSALIHAQGVEAGAETAIDNTNSALGTAY